MGGTCTGEHGVGQKKREYMEEEQGAVAIDLMRRVKASFDPAEPVQSGQGVLRLSALRAPGEGGEVVRPAHPWAPPRRSGERPWLS